MKNEMRLIGKRLKNIRETKELSQSEVARRAGVTRQCISNYEKGVRCASIETIEKLAQALNVDISCLVYTNMTNAPEQFIVVPDENVRNILCKLLCLPSNLRKRYFDHIALDSELQKNIG